MHSDFPDTRWSLIARLGHEPDGQATLIEMYAGAISRYLSMKFPTERSQGQIDDVVQEVLIDLLERPQLFVDAKPGLGSRFRYVVMNAAYLLALNARRRLSRLREARSGIDEVLANANDVPSEHLASMDQAWAASVLAAAWNELAAWADEGALEPGAPELLRRHVGDGVPMRQLADESGLSLASTFRRVAKARTLLQKAITDRLSRAGELPTGVDSARACERLLAAVRPEPL